MTREDMGTDVWPEDTNDILRTIASEVARVADYLEHLAYRDVFADKDHHDATEAVRGIGEP